MELFSIRIRRTFQLVSTLLTHCNADVFRYIWALLTQLRRCKYSMTISYYKAKQEYFILKCNYDGKYQIF